MKNQKLSIDLDLKSLKEEIITTIDEVISQSILSHYSPDLSYFSYSMIKSRNSRTTILPSKIKLDCIRKI